MSDPGRDLRGSDAALAASVAKVERESSAAPGSYHIETWGCQMNVHDSEKLAGSLERQGYVRAEARQHADVILLNTCSIREKAAEKVFDDLGRIKRLKAKNPDLLIGVCGCVAQQEGEQIFRRAPYVDFVMGPRATASLVPTLERLRQGDSSARHAVDVEYRSDSIDFPFESIRREGEGRGKAFVTVIEGCNHRCTYCIVPTTRGREVCRDMDTILAEVRDLAGRGVMEVEFLGQTVNAYRDAAGRTLAELLLATAEQPGIERIRFTTSHPAQMTDRLIEAMGAASPTVCPYLHLPVQSGSSEVLRAMRRGYDRDGYLRKIEALRRRIPGIVFGTDLIVGFPGETDRDFEETIRLLDEVEYGTVFSFTYSERPGTAALEMGDGIPAHVKSNRLTRLQAHQKSIQERVNARWNETEVSVLCEGPSKRDPGRWTGRTPENRVVNYRGDGVPGSLQKVRISGFSAYALRGEQVAAPA
jgi:tRNA-2-methylthio-N6-dimethylallyladenosine synthase